MRDKLLIAGETLFDKPQIINLMRVALSRLRLKRVFVSDILSQLEDVGYIVSRGRFDDWFMTRPERDVIAPISVFVAVVHIFFAFDSYVWNVSEFFQLLIAMRIPINQIDQFSRYFPQDDWQDALSQISVSQSSISNLKPTLIGREPLVEEICDSLRLSQYVVVTGAVGIGKTAILKEVAYRLEYLNEKRVVFITSSNLDSFAKLVDYIAHASGITSLGNEPLLLRLQFVLNNINTYLIIDGINEACKLSSNVIFEYIRNKLPLINLIIVTSELAQDVQHNLDIKCIVIPPLKSNTYRSPGYELFMRMFYQAGGSNIDKATVIRVCQTMHGNPMQICLAANSLAKSLSVKDSREMVFQIMRTFDDTAYDALILLSIIQQPVPLQFLRVFGYAGSEPQFQQMHEAFIQSCLLYEIEIDQNQMVGIHTWIQDIILQTISADKKNSIISGFVHELIDIYDISKITNNKMQAKVKALYFPAVFAIIDILVVSAPEQAVTLLIQLHHIWYRYGMTIDAIDRLEKQLVMVNESSELLASIHFVLGSLYGGRGLFTLSLSHLRMARLIANQHRLTALSHKINVELCWRSISEIHMKPMLFLETIFSIQDSIAYFTSHAMTEDVATAYNVLSHVYFSVGKHKEALVVNDNAVQIFRESGNLLGLSDAKYNRGLVLLGLGDHIAARKSWQQAKEQFMEFGFEMSAVNCDLRIAGVSILQGDAQTAKKILVETFDAVSSRSGMYDVLLMMDIYSGLLFLMGCPCDCYMVSTIMTYIRQERGILLGTFLDGVISDIRQRAYALCEQQSTSSRFNNDSTFYDIVREIRKDIQAWHT